MESTQLTERIKNTSHDVILCLGAIFAVLIGLSLLGHLKGAMGFYDSEKVFTFNYENVDNHSAKATPKPAKHQEE